MFVMNNDLQAENFSLREQLESLLYEARQNEDKMRRFDQLERQLIGAGSLLELLRLLLSEYKLAFGVEFVSLALIDREQEATRILESGPGSDADCRGLTLLGSPDQLEGIYGEKPSPCLGSFNDQQHQTLFNSPLGTISSVALLPLIRQGELIGSLHFGSADPERYVTGCRTDFLERLAGIIAICMESALTKERLKLAGFTDGLTGVQNRRYFEHRLQEEISQARRYKHLLACMFLDIDKFKRINDGYGHQAGDEILRSVANVIQSQLRVGDTIARYGGEEFVVLLPQTAGYHVREIAERIRSTIAGSPIQVHSGHEINVTISIGLSMLTDEDIAGENHQLADSLVGAADKALYQAKHGGRNRVVCDASLPLNLPQNAPWDQILKPLVLCGNSLLQASSEMTGSVLKRLKRA
jgi:diguanylate cyclase (GGDEF)-like protein